LAAALGVPQVAALTTPVADGALTVYLDVWERLATPVEDPSLILPGLGTESCARLRREWVVRTRPDNSAPVRGNPDYINGHSYYALATLNRRNGDAAINPGDVVDRREQQLLLPPATLVSDLLGVTSDEYRRGQGRPIISLREAVNALLRGELPSTPDAPVAPAPGLDVIQRGALFDNTNGVVAVFTSDRFGAANQTFATRLNQDNIQAGFVAPEQVTTGVAHNNPHAALLPNGELVVVYQTSFGGAADVLFKRGQLGGLNAAAETPIANTAGLEESFPMAFVSGDMIVFFYCEGAPTNRWRYRRHRHTDSTWVDAAALDLSATVTTQRDFHAAPDVAGNLWAAFRAGNDLQTLQFNPTTGVVSNEVTTDSGAGIDVTPFVIGLPNGEVWVFWRSPVALHLRRFRAPAWQAVETVTNTAPGDQQPCAVIDADGGVWLFWTRGPVNNGDIFMMRHDPLINAWGQPRQMTLAAGDDAGPFALRAANNAIYVFWSSDRDGNINPYFKRVIPAL
jgi:hypothetical protein